MSQNTRELYFVGYTRIFMAVVLAALSALALLPFLYMAYLSLTQSSTLSLQWKLADLGLENYRHVLIHFHFFRYLENSIIASGLACALNAIISAMAAYGFAKKQFTGKRTLFFLYIVTLMVPSQATLIPQFMLIRELNMLNTYIGLVLPVINAFGVFLLRQFMKEVPDELLAAADMDGSGEIRKFMSIVLPLLRPAIVALTIFTFITTWNDFIWPLVITTDQGMRTLPLALSILKGNYTTNYGLVMAGSLLTFLPPFLLYQVLQRQFIQGIALSGIKG
ncbi:carbohydrate ABC transporter permease [Paenibacillus kribbensis]|uniref:carbohydrate ABC transporter permease n=1 Tax=Paenibacillus kribbensis TaxID=172713 RepID=UPI002DBC66A3|nr:carbohydrate ABC transporter permease [Paenibacillus kribbensis]MEC0236262.1 carbohydrate ABC transporter permease [Paenibacillus kribbensis]